MTKRIAVVLVAVLALAACGSSSSSSGSGSGDKGSPTGNGGSGGSDRGFAALVQKAKDAKYKVTYQSSSGDSFTIAQDPPKFAMTENDSSTFVTADGSSVSCSGTGSSATCTELPGTGTSIQQAMATAFGGIGQIFVTLANESSGVLGGLVNIKTTSKTIAGRDAACATVDKNSIGVLGAAIGNASYSVCVDKDTGVMLSSKATDQSGKSTDEITATDFGSPSDRDFTPPATPSTIPGGMPTVPTT